MTSPDVMPDYNAQRRNAYVMAANDAWQKVPDNDS
jgi:hypothetical protein